MIEDNKDLVIIDRAALLDLMKAVEILTQAVKKAGQPRTLEELRDDNDRLRYVNKLVVTSMKSFEKHNQ